MNIPNRSGHAKPTPDKLRAAIDRGHTGDKVSYPDPAAAPLGTDEEAAGTPISPEALDITFASEARRNVRPARSNGRWVLAAVAAIAFIAAIAIVLVAATV